MNKQLIVGLCVGAVLATAGGAYALREAGPKMADITSVTPITAGMEQQYAEVLAVEEHRDPNAPRFAEVVSARAITAVGPDQEVCEDVVVTHQAPVKDEHQIVGTAAGAVVGGVLGKQVGGGSGKKVATVAGAIVGGVLGKNVQARHQSNQTYQTTERQCRTEYGLEQITGYDVTYQLDNESNVIRLAYKPGSHLPVVNGELITDKAEVSQWNNRKIPERFDVFYQIGNFDGSLVMSRAPRVGELLLAEEGEVVTDPARLADIQADQHQVVAYKVSYRLGNKIGEVRMTERPGGSTLQIKDGQVIVAKASAPGTSI